MRALNSDIGRRAIMKGAMAAAALAPFYPSIASAQQPGSLARAAAQAWIYGLPLIEMAHTRSLQLTDRTPGQIAHSTALVTTKRQIVTAPNNDTLYSSAWLDLSLGPVQITLPANGDRYMSVAFMDMYTNNFALLGSRTTGGEGGVFTLVGPEQASTDPLAIRSPTPWVWMHVRMLINGEADIPAARLLQAGIKVQAPPAPSYARKFATRDAPWNDYFASVQDLISENPAPATDLRFFESMAPLGLAMHDGAFKPEKFSASQIAEIQAGISIARQRLKGSADAKKVLSGWNYPRPDLGNFGQDYGYRAKVAVVGLAALPPVEAMYMQAVSGTGPGFDSSKDYVLRLPGDMLPPVDAFWSLTMYHVTDDDQKFFFDNPINRYSIGDRTPGLVRGPDGSIEIWMTRSDPGGEKSHNWLPTPQSGPFSITARAYLPKAALLDGTYRLPPVTLA